MSSPYRRLLTLLAGVSLALGIGIGSSATSPHASADESAAAHGKPSGGPGSGGTGVSGNQHGGTTGPPTPRPPAAVPLAGGWSYLADPGDVGRAQGWGQGRAPRTGWTPVSIPHDFNPVVAGAGDTGMVGWYRETFTGPSIATGRAWVVAFESVRRNAEVWLNGYPIGTNHDPYGPFALPATSLMPGATNTLIVRVDNARGAGSFPEDWWNWGGITGPVALQPTGRIAVQDLGVTPELSCSYRCGDLRVQGTLTNRSATALTPRVLVRVTSPAGASTTLTHRLKAIKPRAASTVAFPVKVAAPLALWSPSRPSLYRVQVETLVGDRVEQATTMSVGMRSARVSRGILYLNGQRLWLHGAAIHEDISGQGAALGDGDINTIVSQLRSLGANITRAHYQLSPRLLDALDQAGILVWAQPPVDHADAMLRSGGGRSRALGMLRSTLIADRNHPSVIIDSVGNELSATPGTTPGTARYITQAIALARRLNPTVPVALDIYCYPNFPAQKIYAKLDVIGISSYFGWYPGPTGHTIADFNQLQPYLQLQHRRYPHQALAISEFGAEALYDGPPSTKGTYEFQSNYLQQTFGVLDHLSFMNGAIYWTLREFAVSPGWIGGATLPAGYASDDIHHKGLIAYNGTEKPAFTVAQHLFAMLPSYVH
jgi:beta-glucuronidase